MKIYFLILTIICSCIIQSLSEQAYAADKPLALEPLKPGEGADGCSCSIGNGKQNFIQSDFGDEPPPAILRFDGERKELKWISSTEKSSNHKMGESFVRIYGTGSAKLKLSYKTNRVCPGAEEGCEATSYSVDALLEDGKRKTEMKSLKGICGC